MPVQDDAARLEHERRCRDVVVVRRLVEGITRPGQPIERRGDRRRFALIDRDDAVNLVAQTEQNAH